MQKLFRPSVCSMFENILRSGHQSYKKYGSVKFIKLWWSVLILFHLLFWVSMHGRRKAGAKGEGWNRLKHKSRPILLSSSGFFLEPNLPTLIYWTNHLPCSEVKSAESDLGVWNITSAASVNVAAAIRINTATTATIIHNSRRTTPASELVCG